MRYSNIEYYYAEGDSGRMLVFEGERGRKKKTTTGRQGGKTIKNAYMRVFCDSTGTGTHAQMVIEQLIAVLPRYDETFNTQILDTPKVNKNDAERRNQRENTVCRHQATRHKRRLHLGIFCGKGC